MKFVFMTLASSNEAWSLEARQLYQQKIGHYVSFEHKHLKPKKHARENKDQKIKSESDEILKQIENSDFLLLFDEKGKTFDSISFSRQLEQQMSGGKKRIIFLIGGAFGVSDEVKDRANLKVSLSSFVFNHLVAEVVALEQIYRALTIQKNIPYHNV